MLKKPFYNQNRDDELEELEDDPELKELGDDDLKDAENPKSADEDENFGLEDGADEAVETE